MVKVNNGTLSPKRPGTPKRLATPTIPQ
ncbi:hypothetical protein CCACVL1_09253, partial [Corchorus capsularis]